MLIYLFIYLTCVQLLSPIAPNGGIIFHDEAGSEKQTDSISFQVLFLERKLRKILSRYPVWVRDCGSWNTKKIDSHYTANFITKHHSAWRFRYIQSNSTKQQLAFSDHVLLMRI
jgi:hypothetical protein